MEFPQISDVLLPIMKILSDGKPHRIKEVTKSIATEFKIPKEKLSELTPIGKQPKFDVRIRWAVSQLRNADFLENIRLGEFKITNRGKNELKKNPKKIDNALLKQFSEYRQFLGIDEDKETAKLLRKSSPDDSLEQMFKTYGNYLQVDLLSKIKDCRFEKFKEIITNLLKEMRYGDVDNLEVVSIDHFKYLTGIIKEDELGLGKIYVHAQKSENYVSEPEIIKFIMALKQKNISKGILITTGSFNPTVKTYAETEGKDIVLIDGKRLSDLLITNNVGVFITSELKIKKIKDEFFEEN